MSRSMHIRSRISRKMMRRYFGRRWPVGEPRSRWEGAVWTDAVDLLQIRKWRATAKKREGWRKVIGEATNRK
jgi:hypothetical protein